MNKRVKGIFFADYVRMLKRSEREDWSGYLTEEDMGYLNERIRENDWYPFETFERMGLAILSEIAEENMELVRQFGKTYLDRLFSVHASLVSAGDPYESLVRFQVLRKSFFDFDPINILVFHNNYAKIEIAYGMSPRTEEAATWQSLGYFERLLELSGAKNVQHQFTSRMWEGAESTILELDWSELPDGSKVRGVLFADYVRMIKDEKNTDWSAYLNKNDLTFLEQRIRETDWYPMESFERMGIAILREIAMNDMDAIKSWGGHNMDELIKMNPELVTPGDPRESLMKFYVLRTNFFNFDPVQVVTALDNYAKFRVSFHMSRAAEEAATWQTAGLVEKLLEDSGAKSTETVIGAKAWKGDPVTILEVHY